LAESGWPQVGQRFMLRDTSVPHWRQRRGWLTEKQRTSEPRSCPTICAVTVTKPLLFIVLRPPWAAMRPPRVRIFAARLFVGSDASARVPAVPGSTPRSIAGNRARPWIAVSRRGFRTEGKVAQAVCGWGPTRLSVWAPRRARRGCTSGKGSVAGSPTRPIGGRRDSAFGTGAAIGQ
jgi:hypothetical protein